MLHIFLFLCRGMKKWRVHGPKPSIDTGVQVKTLVTSTVCLKSVAVAIGENFVERTVAF